MSAVVKQEFDDPSILKDRIVGLCQERHEGASQEEIFAVCPGVDKTVIIQVINELLQTGQFTPLKLKDGTIAFKLASEESRELEGFTGIEKVVYKKIKESGNQGIWINTLRDHCKVPTVQMNKAIKALEGKKKIKPVKSVTNHMCDKSGALSNKEEKKKKIYMLYELTPAEVISGGNYYQGQEFDDKFAEAIMTVATNFLVSRRTEAEKENPNSPYAAKQSSFASSADVLRFVAGTNVSNVKMTVKDIEDALWGLYHEGKVEYKEQASREEGMQMLWCSTVPLVHPSTGVHQMPCGSCPVMSQCYVGGAISPQECPYMKGWLSF